MNQRLTTRGQTVFLCGKCIETCHERRASLWQNDVQREKARDINIVHPHHRMEGLHGRIQT